VKLIDSHCHLDSEQFDADRDAVIGRALAAGVEHMVAIGSGDGPPDLEAGIRLADRYAPLLATVGVHPHDASKATDDIYRRLAALAAHPKVVAVGETGLDYHYDHSPRAVQRDVFIEQMRIARDARKPIVIHTREAWADTIALLTEHWASSHLGGVIHCFSEGPREAEQALAIGFHISFGGIVTFPKAAGVQEAARITPADRLLIETDAPFLAPVPHRGKRNEPAFVVETAHKLAQLRGVEPAEIARITAGNFRRLTTRDSHRVSEFERGSLPTTGAGPETR
jgi:TatD DNase family protein